MALLPIHNLSRADTVPDLVNAVSTVRGNHVPPALLNGAFSSGDVQDRPFVLDTDRANGTFLGFSAGWQQFNGNNNS